MNNIFKKLLLIITLITGWCGSVWAQRFSPTFATTEAEATTWHYISFSLVDNSKIFANTNNNQLNWSNNAPTDDYKWYLIGNKDNFIMKSVSGKYAYTTETGTNNGVQYLITDDANKATRFKLVNGNNNNTWAINRLSGNAANNLNHRANNGIMEWQVDNGCSVSFSNPANIIQFSDAPTAAGWATNTHWFTMRNNRSNQNNDYNRRYITTSAAGVNDNFAIQPILAATPNDRGSYWCFVGNNSGFVIQNAAYGPDFVLGISGNQNNATVQMFRKGEVPSEYTYNFTAVDNSVVDDGSFAYAFRLGTTGNTHIHVTQGHFIIYSHNNISGGDTGSAFKLTLTDDAVVNALPQYDVYEVEITTGGSVSYKGQRAVFGKRGTLPSSYFILATGGTVTQSDIQTNRNIESFSLNTNTGSYIKKISLALSYPSIVHRTPWTVDKVNIITAGSIPPANTGFLQQDLTNKGMKENTNTSPATKIQNVPVFEVTEYVKPGTSKQIWLPTCNTNGSNSSLWTYQRWYDYRTEGSVDPAVYNFPANKPNGKLFGNGFVTGAIYGDFIGKDLSVTLPTGTQSYDLALDHSRFEDYKKNYDGNDNLLEPTISQRVIYHLVDANVIAQKLEDVPADKWLEEYTIHFPSYKMGSKDARNGFDVIGLNQTFGNYWYYADNAAKAGKNPTQVASKNDFTFEVTCTDPNVNTNALGVGILEKNNSTMPSGLNLQLPKTFAGQRFIMFNYPASRKFADKSELTIKVSVHGKRVAKFTLIFDEGTEPLPILDVIGKDSNGTHKSSRSTSAMIEQYGLPIAKVTFDGPQIPFQFPTGMTTSNQSENIYNWSAENSAKYGLPVANEYTDYSFFGGGGSGNNTYMAMGEYRLDSGGNGTSGRFKIRPVEEYETALNDPSGITTPGYKQYFAFADVSEQPGKIISLPFSTTLCKGQRIFMQGWVGSATSSNDNGQQQSGVILKVYGFKNNQRTLVYSYCPGMISSAIEKDGTIYRSVDNDFSGYRQSCNDNNDWVNQGFVIWHQVNCSFLVNGDIQYDSYQLEVDNNSYSSTGCDVIIDNFYIFVNPPKGTVDFTTPLCNDKTRHAKIHADFDMLKNISNVNEIDLDAKLNVTVCFLEADVFDKYSNGILKISDIFDVDENGNHNLKAEYTDNANAKALINEAFGAALVGTRQTSVGNPADHGFHVYEISQNYESIPEYAYNDSKTDVVYREIVDGIRRIVFKEDVVRGDQTLLADGRWPHMRPSTTYYLVFSPMKATQEDIDHHSTATDIFHIHESCSFFGKFTTKDPMHVILDNAEIAADLPVQAVCHGETMELSFDMPALKEEKKINGVIPIFDEANCTSIESKNDQYVSGTEGPKYKYEPVLTTELVQTRIKNLPYDWWFGGDYEGTKIGGTFEAYMAAKHPSIKYSHPEHNHTHAEGYKKDGEYVDIPLAMKDLRFYYPDFGKDKETLTSDDWNTIYRHDYDNDAGYSLLQSEINAIRDLVDRGILVLHRTNYDLSLSTETAEDEGGQKVVNFTLVPIMPSQQNYVDEPYIYCPEPRGVKVKLRDAAPKMLNGFGDKTYPTDMQNVPVRAGLQQLNAVSHDLASVISADAKKLRVPLRGLSKALDEGKYLMPYEKTTGNVAINTVFLVDTNDPVYENKFDNQEQLSAWGKITQMQADFTKNGNFMDLVFNKDYKMREGYTYRIGVRFVEVTDEAKTTRDIACDGIFYFDLKVVPEFQVWTGKESVKNPTNITEWTNDRNWARADRTDLLADGTKTGNVITAATDYAVVDNYPNNDDNFGNHTWGADSLGFMPMYFTNVLFNEVDVEAPILSAASIDSSTGFLSTAGTQSNRSGFEHHVMIDHEITDKQIAFIKNDAAAKDQKVFSIVYDMSVAPTGSDNNVMALTNRYEAPFNGSSYMCEPFGTNVTKGITFAPQTQLINAQHLTYYKAWVEYELDVNRWYTLGSPLQNTFAGEWYAPTKGAQQNSPYFYDVKYVQREGTGASATGYNDRFRPAIYQRSWDSKDNVPVYLKAGGTASWGSGSSQNTEPAYVKADWSYVFNDVKKQYSTGGFSVKVNTDLMNTVDKPADDKAIVRLPKADTQYTYYDSDGTTGVQYNNVKLVENGEIENRGRLWSDKLASDTSFPQTITNSENGNNFFLVNNPFIANMDMDKFFEVNTQFEKKYWIMSADHQIVSVKLSNDSWVATDGSNFAAANAKVGPLQGFFVKGNNTDKSVTVTFNAAMQATTEASKAIQTRAASTPAPLSQLAISATRNGYTSTAVVTLSALASNDFKAEEDAQTFVDGNVLSEPTLYTVASDQAMTINTLSNIEVLPLGIVSDDDSEVILTFNLDSYEGHDLQLFDAVTRQLIDLSSDTELAVSGNNSNRYYIARAGALNQFGDRMQNLDGEIYNLQGLQLGTAGKGTIVIINGEKHIVK